MGASIGTKYYLGDDRFAAFFAHPNQFGIVNGCFLLVFLGRFCNSGNKMFNAFFILIAFINIVYSGSKSTLAIVLFVGALVVMYEMKGAKSFLIGLVSLLFAIVLSFIFYEDIYNLNPRLFMVFIDNDLSSLLEYRTLQERYLLWSYSIEVASSFPLTGEGVSKEIFDYYTHSHNLIFDYIRTFGYLGLIIIWFVFLSLSLGGYKLYLSEARFCFSAVLSFFLINMMSDSMGPQTVPVLSFMLAAFLKSSRCVFKNDDCHL